MILIEKLREPIRDIVEDSEFILCKIANDCLQRTFKGYPSQIVSLGEYVSEFIRKKSTECLNFLNKNIDVLKIPYTNDLNYLNKIDEYLHIRNISKVTTRSTNIKNSQPSSPTNEIFITDSTQYITQQSLISNIIPIEVKATTNLVNNIINSPILNINENQNKSPSFENSNLSIKEKIDEMRIRNDNFYRMIMISKLRDLVPGAVYNFLLLETSENINKYLIKILSRQEYLINSLREEEEIYGERLSIKEQIRKIEELKRMLVGY